MNNTLSHFLSGQSVNINILRFICALAVIVTHSYYLSANVPDFLHFFTNGQINLGGVSVGFFFFVSGLYISKSIQKAKTAREFIKKRVDRIFPQLWLVVILCVFLLGPILTNNSILSYFTDIKTYLYLLNGLLIPIHNLPGVFEGNIYNATVNGALWTLPVEFVGYIALCIIWILSKKCANEYLIHRLLNVLAFVLLFILLGIAQFVDNSMIILATRAMLMFFVGAIYFDYSKNIVLNIKLALLLAIILLLSTQTIFFNVCFVIFFPYLIICFVFKLPNLCKNYKILSLSYEMYLVAFPLQQMLVHLFGGQMSIWINVLISIFLDIICAYLVDAMLEFFRKYSIKQELRKI